VSTEHDRQQAEPARDQNRPRHAAPEGADVHPLIDLSRDPRPDVPDHAKPDDE
jgi:hypothetical protein